MYRVELHVSVSLTIGRQQQPIWVTRSVHQQQPPTTKCTEPSPPPLAMNGKENPLIVNALPHRLADCAIALWYCCSPERQRERSQGNHYNSTIVCNWMDGGGVFATHGPTAPSLPLLLPPTNNPIHPSSISSSSHSQPANSTSSQANRENIRWARDNRNYLFSTKLCRQVLNSLPGAPPPSIPSTAPQQDNRGVVEWFCVSAESRMYSHIVSSGFLSLETLRLRSLIQVNIIRRLLHGGADR